MEQVYIFDFGDKIKAGYSTDVKKRLRTIELSSGVRAKQSYCVQAGRKEEKLLHSWLTNRLEGEFFAFPFGEARSILDKIVQGDIIAPPAKEKIKLGSKGHIVYNKLFARLEVEGKSATAWLRSEGIHPSIVNKLRKNDKVNIDTIDRICALLDCQPGDIMEYVKE